MSGNGEDQDKKHVIKLIEGNVIDGRLKFSDIEHGDPDIIGRSFYAIAHGTFPCAKSSYYDRDREGCDWCQDLINRIKSRRIF